MTIKEIRKMRNMTQQELADIIGVSLALISRYESGKITPPAYRLESIARALDVSVDDILDDNPANASKVFLSDSTYFTSQPSYMSAKNQVAKYVRSHVGGFCELCGQPAPFRDKQGAPYLEVYFITPLSKGGRCDIWNAVALCPNCYKRVQILQDPEDMSKLVDIADHHR